MGAIPVIPQRVRSSFRLALPPSLGFAAQVPGLTHEVSPWHSRHARPPYPHANSSFPPRQMLLLQHPVQLIGEHL